MVIFHSYVSLPEGSANNIISIYLFMAILEKIYIYITIYLFIIFPSCWYSANALYHDSDIYSMMRL